MRPHTVVQPLVYFSHENRLMERKRSCAQSSARSSFSRCSKNFNRTFLCFRKPKRTPTSFPTQCEICLVTSLFLIPTKSKGGYSGTAIYTKQEPKEVKYGMGVPKFDNEGRIVTAHYENLIVSNIYFPNGGQGPERLQYKLEFYEAFLEYVENLRKTNSVVWGGDVNTAHEEIDLARPKENQETTGFLPEERAWLDEVVACGWVDTFRHFYPEKEGAYSYWDMKTRARDRNVGWRIDYLFASPDLLPRTQKSHQSTTAF